MVAQQQVYNDDDHHHTRFHWTEQSQPAYYICFKRSDSDLGNNSEQLVTILLHLTNLVQNI